MEKKLKLPHLSRRVKVVIGALSLVAGVAAPIAVQAGPAAAANDSFIINDASTDQIGLASGNQTWDLGDGSQQTNLYYEGQVATAAQGGPWPFDIASDDSYYDGDNVWIIYKQGTNYCQTATLIAGNYSDEYTNTACGLSHTYSLIVQAPPWDGTGSSHESWVDVGATDHTVSGSYACDPGYGSELSWRTSCSGTKDSFRTVVG